MTHTIRFFLALTIVLCAAFVSNAPAIAAPEATFVVNTTKTAGFDGICSAFECALAEAINAANASPGKDKIIFNIPANTDPGCVAATGICTLHFDSPLPKLTGPVIIDGYSQPGASPNTLPVGMNTVLKIQLTGNGPYETPAIGFAVEGGLSEIRGLALTGFGVPIHLRSHQNRVHGNFIGLNADGSVVEEQGPEGAQNSVAVGIDPTSISELNGGKSLPDAFRERAKNAPEEANAALLVDNQIGSAKPADRNLISGNRNGGLLIQSTFGTQIKGNYFGTDMSGLRLLPGENDDIIELDNSVLWSIGGLEPGEGNVIGGAGYALWFFWGAKSGKIISNHIGAGADGVAAIGNYVGIHIGDKVNDVQILHNIIANNTAQGVAFQPQQHDPKNVSVSRNRIYNNGELGIDLEKNGVTPNDPQDVDSGPNNFQNYPVLTQVQVSPVGTTINGKLNSAPNKTYRIEFFTNPGCDPSGFGEGKRYLGVESVITGGDGKANFTFLTTKVLLAGTQVTATATDADAQGNPLNTSEFSKCKAAS